jgi:hypothetical protein
LMVGRRIVFWKFESSQPGHVGLGGCEPGLRLTRRTSSYWRVTFEGEDCAAVLLEELDAGPEATSPKRLPDEAALTSDDLLGHEASAVGFMIWYAW